MNATLDCVIMRLANLMLVVLFSICLPKAISSEARADKIQGQHVWDTV